jgi:ATP-dependent RNA helicase DDX51/DBP6
MASQIYSRYVPPKKKQRVEVVDNAAPVISSTTSLSSSQQTPQERPSTKQDASATYTRYIPPSSKRKSQPAVAEDETVNHTSVVTKRKRETLENNSEVKEPIKKTKKPEKSTERTDSLPTDHPSSAQGSDLPNGVHHVNGDLPEKKKRTKERRDSGPGDNTEAVDNDGIKVDDEDARHKSILTKREKSLKKAEKLARKAALETAPSDEPDKDEPMVKEVPPELHPLEPLPQPEPVPESTGKPTFSALPPWLESPIRVSPDATSSFTDLGIEKKVVEVLQSKGFANAFAVQSAVLPLLLQSDERQRGDVLVSAATGSGKTLAYVLPMIGHISKSTVTRLRGVIVMPTRELVNQARDVCEICATAFAGSNGRRVKVGVAVGNQTLKTEQASLMNKEQRYDWQEYQKQEQHAKAKWESSSQETDDEDFILYEDEDTTTLPGHVIEYSSRVDVLICTPGRLVEHIKSTPGFTLDYMKWLVIDEADKLLDQSFQQWLELVMARLEQKSKQTVLWRNRRSESNVTKVVLSATVTRDLGQLSALKLRRPKLVVLEGGEQISTDGTELKSDAIYNIPTSLQESAVKVENDSEKPLYLLELIKAHKMVKEIAISDPVDSYEDNSSSSSDDSSSSEDDSSSDEDSPDDDSETSASSSEIPDSPAPVKDRTSEQSTEVDDSTKGVLIFTKSNETALRLSRLLSLLSPSLSTKVGTLTSTIRASSRKRTLRNFLRGHLSIIVASDLVARGLDIPNLAHVVNYDIPTSLTSYVHRVGRTARAGREGHAWTLVGNTEARWFWNEIARSELLRRAEGRRVERVSIDAAKFGEGLREKYEEALKLLGEEASGRRDRGVRGKS